VVSDSALEWVQDISDDIKVMRTESQMTGSLVPELARTFSWYEATLATMKSRAGEHRGRWGGERFQRQNPALRIKGKEGEGNGLGFVGGSEVVRRL
jgi:hypothetical protein